MTETNIEEVVAELAPTKRDQLFQLHDRLAKSAKSIMRKKNADYGRDNDPLFNFRRHGLKGMLVRLDDKLCRLDSFVDRGILEVADESVEDTLVDIVNYAILFAFWVQEQKR